MSSIFHISSLAITPSFKRNCVKEIQLDICHQPWRFSRGFVWFIKFLGAVFNVKVQLLELFLLLLFRQLKRQLLLRIQNANFSKRSSHSFGHPTEEWNTVSEFCLPLWIFCTSPLISIPKSSTGCNAPPVNESREKLRCILCARNVSRSSIYSAINFCSSDFISCTQNKIGKLTF